MICRAGSTAIHAQSRAGQRAEHAGVDRHGRRRLDPRDRERVDEKRAARLYSQVLGAVGETGMVRRRSEDRRRHRDFWAAGRPHVFYFIEALQEAARQLGMDEAQGRALAVATFTGAAQLAA